MPDRDSPTPTAAPHPRSDGPLVRVDAMALALARTDPDGTRYELAPEGVLTAQSSPVVLPLFAAWAARGTLELALRGQAAGPFDAQLALGGAPVGAAVRATHDPVTGDFTLALTAPFSALAPATTAGSAVTLALRIAPGLRALGLFRLQLVALEGPAPEITVFDLREATDSALFDAPERKLFDLQNPEEGFWVASGRFRLRLSVGWSRSGDGPAPAWSLALRPDAIAHNHRVADDATDVVYEDVPRRAGERFSYTELYLNTSHASLAGRVAPEGFDLPVALAAEHAFAFGERRARLTWRRTVGLRLRDPRPLLQGFKRLSAVGIDFGTTATVAAFTHRGFRSLMRLGSPPDDTDPAENPVYLLVDDHERLFATMAAHGEDAPAGARRFPHLVRLVEASHLARAQIGKHPNAVVGEIKSLPERVILLDQSPQLRDRARHADFILDEARVRTLVRTYAYLLGRAINRPGHDVYLSYWLTYPAEFDERARALLEEEIRAGILLSIPEGIPAAEVTVAMRATEPEAYAAEVCPELVNHPAIEALVAKHGELRFAVFDMGGGTLDIACGRYRPATDAEQAQSGCSSVIETLQVAGNDHLGGEYLTHELVWLIHQHDAVLPEMEQKDVPMQRPQTVPENKLARHGHLYKRSLAARQNKIRFERELGVERLKFRRANKLAPVPALAATRLDGSEVALAAFAQDNPALGARLTTHLDERIEDGARLLAATLAGTAWGGGAPGDWREQGVLILLAGNSSRSEYVAEALGRALGIEGLAVWRPSDPGPPAAGVVLYETAPRRERGVEILGVTPKTAVALGALKIANREVHLVRAAQGFSYFVGDMKGFPPKFTALIPMGAAPGDPTVWGPHYVEFGTWDAQKPLRVATQYEPGKMTSNDPRLLTIPTGLPPGAVGKLYICVVSPTRIGLHLALPDGEQHVRSELNLAPYLT